MTTYIALLRGVNVVGSNRVAMADLRAACSKAGFANVRTYVNSGNLVLVDGGKAAEVEARLEAVLAGLGVAVPVLVRTAAQWARYAQGNPFPDAQPNFLHLCLAKAKPKAGAADALRQRAAGGERIAAVGDAIWVDYASGVGRSKVSPAALDRAAGSPVTARNWNTVRRLGELARG